MKRRTAGALAVGIATLLAASTASAYIEAPHTLGRVTQESTNVLVVRVEKVERGRNLIIFRKVRDLKGNHNGDVIKHNIGDAGFSPRESRTIMAWAEPGKVAVIFHNGAASETCIPNYWYQNANGGEWWTLNHGEPYLLRSFCGDPQKLIAAVTAMIAGQEVVVPCMVDGNKDALQQGNAKLQRLKASLKIQDYEPKRDFVGWGDESYRRLVDMPGFTHIATLKRIGPDALGVVAADADGDGRADPLLFGAGNLGLFQNGDAAPSEVSLPYPGGARAPRGPTSTATASPTSSSPRRPAPSCSPTGAPPSRTNPRECRKSPIPARPPPPGSTSTATPTPTSSWPKAPSASACIATSPATRTPTRAVPPCSAPGRLSAPSPTTAARGSPRHIPPSPKSDSTPNTRAPEARRRPGRTGISRTARSTRSTSSSPRTPTTPSSTSTARSSRARPSICPSSFGSDDSLTVWLNGAKVVEENVNRACTPDTTKTTLRLKPGKNQLLLKICQGSGEWGFYFKAGEAASAVPQTFADVSTSVGLGLEGLGGPLKADRLAVADVDGDGRPDFLATSGDGLLALNTPGGFVAAKDSGLRFTTGQGHARLRRLRRRRQARPVRPPARRLQALPERGRRPIRRRDPEFRRPPEAECEGDLRRVGRLGESGAAGPVRRLPARPESTLPQQRRRDVRRRDRGSRPLPAHLQHQGPGVDRPEQGRHPDLVLVNEGQDSAVLLGNPALRGKPRVADARDRPGDDPTMSRLAAIAALSLLIAAARGDDWPTYQGNPARTGNVDGVAGPKAPRVCGSSRRPSNTSPRPSPAGKALYVSGLGAFNTVDVHALSLDRPRRGGTSGPSRPLS